MWYKKKHQYVSLSHVCDCTHSNICYIPKNIPIANKGYKLMKYRIFYFVIDSIGKIVSENIANYHFLNKFLEI